MILHKSPTKIIELSFVFKKAGRWLRFGGEKVTDLFPRLQIITNEIDKSYFKSIALFLFRKEIYLTLKIYNDMKLYQIHQSDKEPYKITTITLTQEGEVLKRSVSDSTGKLLEETEEVIVRKPKEKLSFIEKAKKYAIHCHYSTNHGYDMQPYTFHLEMVIQFLYQFIHLVPEQDRDLVIAAAWCHDVIEDTRQTYNDVAKKLSKEVADIVYALTAEKGKSRDERNSAIYYQGISNTKYATLIKVCDRIANVTYSIQNNSSMKDKYKKENAKFVALLFDPTYQEAFTYLKKIIDTI